VWLAIQKGPDACQRAAWDELLMLTVFSLDNCFDCQCIATEGQSAIVEGYNQKHLSTEWLSAQAERIKTSCDPHVEGFIRKLETGISAGVLQIGQWLLPLQTCVACAAFSRLRSFAVSKGLAKALTRALYCKIKYPNHSSSPDVMLIYSLSLICSSIQRYSLQHPLDSMFC
jgi:hypothetical protein